jgi:hypothetical protein
VEGGGAGAHERCARSTSPARLCALRSRGGAVRTRRGAVMGGGRARRRRRRRLARGGGTPPAEALCGSGRRAEHLREGACASARRTRPLVAARGRCAGEGARKGLEGALRSGGAERCGCARKRGARRRATYRDAPACAAAAVLAPPVALHVHVALPAVRVAPRRLPRCRGRARLSAPRGESATAREHPRWCVEL